MTVEKDNQDIHVQIGDESYTCHRGVTLLELLNLLKYKNDLDVLAGKVNNKIKDLNTVLEQDCTVEFIDLSSEDGVRVYKRSLFFVLIMAVKELYPDRKLSIRHSISRGTYCKLYGEQPMTETDVKRIHEKMKELIEQQVPIVKDSESIQKAKELFEKAGDHDKVELLKYCPKETLSLYTCKNMVNYLYGCLVPHTGYVKQFELMHYAPGFILRYPDKQSPHEVPPYEENRKLFEILAEHRRWGEILGVSDVGSLNEFIASGRQNEVIQISEALHEKKIGYIADLVKERVPDIKIALISGPSSSGKTTFAHRLAIHLRVNGLIPMTISLDDYFIDREHTPRDEFGKPDYEALEAIDVTMFNDHLSRLIQGEEVEIPIFNFHLGQREPQGRKLKIREGQIVIIEGIHGLNEKLTAAIPKQNKFKIYVSALTQLSLDHHNPISTTDTRLVRRMVRDFNFRSSSALRTFEMWPSVRRGEIKNIFPYQEQADVMFNSALPYELAVLKKYAVPLLEGVSASETDYSEARRLIDFLTYFLPVEPDTVPPTSIMREFIGGSSLY